MKVYVLILIFLIALYWLSTATGRLSSSPFTDTNTEGLERGISGSGYENIGLPDCSFVKRSESMVRICGQENESSTVVLNSQLNLTWMTVGSSTIISPPVEIKTKIDANLLNLTNLLMKGYLGNNQTNVIMSLSDGNTPQTIEQDADFSGLLADFHTTYASENAYNQTDFLTGQINYTQIFELAANPEVAHIWLDRKFSVCLDQSVPLIKDPAQWAKIESSYGRSINGTGVKIAILDTGIDSTHPDFSFPNGTSKIVGAVSFVTGETTSDGYGHGTHCASIAAGTGAASSYQYVGVAPGASLMNVKVLDNQGQGQEDWIVSGIQWAVDNKANVLSMSLGTTEGGDGSDPLSTTVSWAVNQGAVCVVAAGNSGPQMYTISSPGVAQLAITVGASTKSDVVADFSSNGPTSDYRVKPDVVAPGVDIVAARASGTSMGTPVSAYYTRASGTSMATPHVAGAAALLLDTHPSWNPMMVKMSLSNCALDIGANVLSQGSGRIDICKAVNASAVGNSSISFGKLSMNTVYRQAFTIQNLAGSTLSIALNAVAWHIGDGTVYNVASLNTSNLVLSGGAKGTVGLDISTTPTIPDGYFEGRITATFDDASIRIPFFFCILSQVNVEVTDESGSALKAAFVLIDAQTSATVTYTTENDSAQFTMLHGTYIIQAMNIYALNPSGSLDKRVSFLLHKRLSVGIGETTNLQLSLTSAYKLQVRTTDVQGSPLFVVQKQLLTPYYTMGYLSEIGTLNSQYIYLTNLAEYMKPPCFFGYQGFTQDNTHWKNTGIVTSQVDMYFIGWDLSTFGLPNIPGSLDYANSELATFNIDTMLPTSSAVSKLWFNQIAGIWQSGLWQGYQINPGILWKAHILPYQYQTSVGWSQLEWSCIYVFSASPYSSPEQYVIDRHFQPITKGENASYSVGKTPLLPQDVVSNPPYYGNGLYISYYPLRVERNLFIAKTDTQATKRLEVFQNGHLIDNETKAWSQAPIPISQFVNSYGYGLYSFVLKTTTSFNYSSQDVAEYTINYTSANTDLIPPSITRIDCYPCFTRNDDQVQVQVSDNNEISNVSLMYSTDNGPYLPTNLQDLGNGCYSADLALSTGTQKLTLIVEASDGKGNKIRFTTDPAATRGYQTRIDANLNGGTITGRLNVIGGSLLQPVYLKVKSNGQTMYTLTDASGNFAFNIPPSFVFQMEIEMSPTGPYDGSSWVTDFLVVQTEPAGIVSIPGGGWYTPATNVTLTAPASLNVSPNTRYGFNYWDVDGVSQGSGANPITVHMDTNHTATAHYITQYTVLVTHTGLSSDATGTVVIVNGITKSFVDLPLTSWVDTGSSVTYSYDSPVSSTISGKRFRLDSVTGAASPITVSAPVTVAGNYKTQYYLTVRTDPTGIATIPGEGWYDDGTPLTLTAPAIQNYQFNYWDVDGVSQGSQVNQITVSMNAAHLATAHYALTAPNHTIAITNITTPKSIVGNGFSTFIIVTVMDDGDYSETFNTTVYANQTIIATSVNTTLTPRNYTTLTFTWNTTGFAYGNYLINAYAWPVPGEINISNNNMTGGWVVVAGAGDLTGGTPNAFDFVPDGQVNIVDLSVVAKFFGQKVPPAPGNCDVSGPTVGVPDGKINISDLAAVAKHFGQHYS
jgi:serine protease AprX